MIHEHIFTILVLGIFSDYKIKNYILACMISIVILVGVINFY